MQDRPKTNCARREALYLEASECFGAAIARLAAAHEAIPAERSDLEQAIHVELWRSLDAFEGRSSLRTWVFRVAHNVAASHVSAARRHRQVMVDAPQQDGEPESAEAPPDEQLAQRQMLAVLHRLIRGLNTTDRQVMLLYLEDVDAGSIAEITGLTPGAVATRISRAKDLLKARFEAGEA